MTTENITIQLQDNVPVSISEKITKIETASTSAFNALEKLQQQLNSIGSNSALEKMSQSLARMSAENTKLITSQNQALTALNNSAISQERLALAQNKTAKSATDAAIAEARLQTTLAQTAAANDRAAITALKLEAAQAKQASTLTNTKNLTDDFLTSIVAYVSVGAAAAYVLHLADSYTSLQNRLQNVSTSQAQINELTHDLIQVANTARVDVTELSTIYARYDAVLSRLGASQQESLRFTQTLSESFAINGATAAESASALLQVSQALNRGKLQGEDFRTLMHYLGPDVQEAIRKIADPSGKANLQDLATQGKITADVLRRAIAGVADEMDEKIGKTNFTLGQSFIILKNNATEFFGELNKQTGFTAFLSEAIIALANNLNLLKVAAVSAGLAMTVAFGPLLLTEIVAATEALAAFSLIALTSPIGWAAAIGGAVAAYEIYGDKINAGIDKQTTLKNVGAALWNDLNSDIQDASSSLGEFVDKLEKMDDSGKLKNLSAAIKKESQSWTESFNSFFESDYTGWAKVLDNTAKVLDTLAGYIDGFAITIANAFQGLPALVFNALNDLGNKAGAFLNNLIESYNNLAQSIGAKPLKLVDLPDYTVDKNYFDNYINKVMNGFNEGIDAQGGLLKNKVKQLFNDAEAIARGELDRKPLELFKLPDPNKVTDFLANIAQQSKPIELFKLPTSSTQGNSLSQLNNSFPTFGNNSALRGAGPNTEPAPGPSKAEENRATALAKINKQLDDQTARLFTLREAREAQTKLDQIEENLLGKKIFLNDTERASIKGKIDEIQKQTLVQKEFDKLYDQATGPLKTYQATIKASSKLLDEHVISQKQNVDNINKAAESYKTAIDPVYQLNKQIDEQTRLIAMASKEREVERQVIQAVNAAKEASNSLSTAETNLLREKLKNQQALSDVMRQYDKITQQTSGQESELEAKTVALTTANSNHLISLEQLKIGLNEVSIEQAKLKESQGNANFGDVVTASLDGVLQGYQGLLRGLSSSFSDFFKGMADGFANTTAKAIVQGKSIKEAWGDIGQTIETELIASLIKLGVQYVVTSDLGETLSASAMAAATGISLAAATAIAAAWVPAEAAVTLATLGTNLAPATTAIGATHALAKALSVLPGHETGGYTGNAPTNKIAGVVHGQEFVMNAKATARIGVNNLQALQNGANSVNSNSKSVGIVGNQKAQAPQVNVTTPVSAIVVSTREEAFAAMQSREGKVFIMETVREHGNEVAKIAGSRG